MTAYTFEIVRVDPAARAMDIRYTSPTYGTILVGARMPWEGETIEDIVRMFSPVRYWIEQTLPVVSVTEGASGSLEEVQPPPASEIREPSKINLIRAMRGVDYGQATLWDAVKALLAQADETTREDWDAANFIPENDPVILAMAATLYPDPAVAAAQIDAVFAAAVA